MFVRLVALLLVLLVLLMVWGNPDRDFRRPSGGIISKGQEIHDHGDRRVTMGYDELTMEPGFSGDETVRLCKTTQRHHMGRRMK